MATDDVLKNITVVRNNNKLLSSHNCHCSTSVRPVSKRRWVSNPTLWGTQAVAHDLRPYHSLPKVTPNPDIGVQGREHSLVTLRFDI